MPFGAVVHRLETVVSTNDAARALALGGAGHGTAVLAREQTGGRGTKGRSWHSPAGLGLYASFILRGPEGGAVPFPHLVPLAAGLAATDAVLEAAGIQSRLKWPNDILHDGKKLGGVLSEGVGAGAAGGFLVVGVGINAGQGLDDFPPEIRTTATSLRLIGGSAPSVEALWGSLCRTLERWYNVLARGNKEAVVTAFASRSAIPPGARVRVETAGEAFDAEYRGLDAEGRLVVWRGGADPVVLDAVLRLERTR